MVVRVLVDLVQFYIVVLFVRIILSWFPVNPWSKLNGPVRVLAKVTDPVLVPVRRMLPPMRVGGAAIDLSPLVVFLGLEVIVIILSR